MMLSPLLADVTLASAAPVSLHLTQVKYSVADLKSLPQLQISEPIALPEYVCLPAIYTETFPLLPAPSVATMVPLADAVYLPLESGFISFPFNVTLLTPDISSYTENWVAVQYVALLLIPIIKGAVVSFFSSGTGVGAGVSVGAGLGVTSGLTVLVMTILVSE